MLMQDDKLNVKLKKKTMIEKKATLPALRNQDLTENMILE